MINKKRSSKSKKQSKLEDAFDKQNSINQSQSEDPSMPNEDKGNSETMMNA